MKVLKQKFVPFLLVNLLSLGVTACGSPGSPIPPFNNGTGTSMGAAGYTVPPVGTPMMGIPGAGYNGSPVMGPVAGCYPLTAPIPFSAQNAFINADVIKAGVVPPGLDPYPLEGGTMPHGTVLYGGMLQGPAMTVNPMVQSLGGGLMITNRQEADGTLRVSVTTAAMGNPTAAITGAPAFMNGVIYVSPAKAAIINATHGTGSMFTGSMPYFNSACVSAISLSMSYTYSGYGLTFNGGRVFLYLNGTQHGSYLQL